MLIVRFKSATLLVTLMRCVLVLPVFMLEMVLATQVCVCGGKHTEQVNACNKIQRSMQKWHAMSWWHSKAACYVLVAFKWHAMPWWHSRVQL